MNESLKPEIPGNFNIAGLNDELTVTFYCSSCDMNVTIDICDVNNMEQALKEAWKEARKYFNRCHYCGAWVCDEHYNENVMKCISCHPK